MKGKLVIAGLGPGPLGMLTEAAKQAVLNADKVFVQTARHPAVSALINMGVDVQPLDELYQSAQDFDALNAAVAKTVLDSAVLRHTVFAVSGHGLTGQAVMADILKKADDCGVQTVVCPGIGFEDAAIAAAKLDVSKGYAVHVGAVRAQSMDSAVINVVLDVDTRLRAGEIKIELMKRYEDETVVYLIQADASRIGCTGLPLAELDRQQYFDAFTAVVLPAQPLLDKQRFTVSDLVEICRILRAPGGCPWDREQTHTSIRRNMMEECCEAMAAISEGDDRHLCEELGDVMLQVALHAQMASEEGSFELLDVATAICQKMIRRHPHIFGQERADTAMDVVDTWERIKEQERNGVPKNPFQKVGEGLPALMRSQELQKIFFGEEKDVDLITKALADALDELSLSADVHAAERHAGEALWTICRLLRVFDVHAETALSDRCAMEVDRHQDMDNACETEIMMTKYDDC